MDSRRRRVALLACLLLASCAHVDMHNPLARWTPSPNFNQRRPVLIVLHATEQDSVAESIDTLRTANSGGRVSAHYLIGRDGQRYQLVDDDRRAWHAGAGRWGTITDVNSASIGIELDNDGTSPFADAQIDSLIVLLRDLCTRLDIPPTQVIAHADLAPTRKRDPGALFPWRRLADAGFGRWPDAKAKAAAPGFDPWLALTALGYPRGDGSSDLRAATVRAFHRHYRGSATDVLDVEDLRILSALTAQ